MAFPSTFLDLQNAVITRARLDPVNDLAKVRDWINISYTQACVETECNVTFATMTLTSGSGPYTLPAGVARIKQMFITPAGQTSALQQSPLTLTTLDDILQKRRVGGVTPQAGAYSTHYTLLGINEFEVWPTPPAADVLTIYYAAFPTPLSANGDLPIIEEPYATYLLQYGALAQAGDWKGDPAAGEWQGTFAQYMGAYQAHLEAKQGDRPTYGHTWGTPDRPSPWYGNWRG